jgi:hypothetical protein
LRRPIGFMRLVSGISSPCRQALAGFRRARPFCCVLWSYNQLERNDRSSDFCRGIVTLALPGLGPDLWGRERRFHFCIERIQSVRRLFLQLWPGRLEARAADEARRISKRIAILSGQHKHGNMISDNPQ